MQTAKRFSMFLLIAALLLPLVAEPSTWGFVSAQDDVPTIADVDADGIEDATDNVAGTTSTQSDRKATGRAALTYLFDNG